MRDFLALVNGLLGAVALIWSAVTIILSNDPGELKMAVVGLIFAAALLVNCVVDRDID
mgnify:CR=1 FL=1